MMEGCRSLCAPGPTRGLRRRRLHPMATNTKSRASSPNAGKGARTEYLVRWKDWPIWEATWERRKSLDGAVEILDAFESNLRVNVLNTLDTTITRNPSDTTSVAEHRHRSHQPQRVQQTPQAPIRRISQASTSPRTHTVSRARVSGLVDSVIRARMDSRQASTADKQRPGTRQQHGNNANGPTTYITPNTVTLKKTKLTPSPGAKSTYTERTLDPSRIAGSRGHEYLRLAKFHTLTAF